MIREAQRSELPALLELWLESTTWGHPFIKSSYWRDCIPLVRDAYLANAQNWVWEEDGKLLGFVSIMEGRFLAAMFVAPKAVRRGIGKALMQYVQQRHPHLMLEVYQKNQPAIDFYHAQGFHIVDCAWQDETQLPTWIMSWYRWFKRCNCQFRTVVFFQPCQRRITRTAIPQPRAGEIFGQHVHCAVFTNAVSG
ncbi:hypothetical protein ECO2947_00925 [Escherichia coli]|nr:hypothetical protein ECO1752_00940 [Escherichia coli]CAK5455984.1 hypothetical protein ECO2947_00925 [Escherichia coli]